MDKIIPPILSKRYAASLLRVLSCAARSDDSNDLVVTDDLGIDRELLVVLVGEPQTTSDLGKDVPDSFPISDLLENEDLVVPELIAIGLRCHVGSPFLVGG